MKEKMKSIVNLGKEFAAGMGQRRLTVYATSGCYYMFMSLVPTVMILCCILPYTPFSLSTILDYIDEYFAEQLGVILRNIATAVYASNSATLTISIFLTLFSASAAMKALMRGMNSAYDFESHDNFIVFTVKALVYMVLMAGTVLLSLIIMVYGGKILSIIHRYFMYVGFLSALLSRGRYFLVMIVLAIVFLFLYKVMPAEKVALKDQIPGVIFSAITWVIFSWIFTIYISVSDKFGAYGFIGTIMVAMMWIYYCLFFLLIGGYMNSFLHARKAENTGYVLVNETADAENTLESTIESTIERTMAEDEDDMESAIENAMIAYSDLEDEDTDSSIVRNMDDNLSNTGSISTGIVANSDVANSGIISTPGDDLSSLSDELDALAEEIEAEEAAAKKKLTVPILIGAIACALAAFAAVFFFFKSKKSKTEVAVK